MSLLGRLFGSRPAAPDHAVVIPDELAAALTSDGRPLAEVVLEVLRTHRAAESNPPAPQPERAAEGAPAGMPFWLDRAGEPAPPAAAGGAEERGDIDDELRDRVIQRHSTEAER